MNSPFIAFSTPNASSQKRVGSSYALSARFNAASSVFLQSYDRLRPPLLPHTDSSGRNKSRSGSSHNISSHIAFSDTCNRVDSSVWRAYPTPHAAQTRADCAGSEPASLPRVLSDAPARHAPLQPHTGLFLQLTQLQPLQNTSDAKHSQYSFKHRDFRQLHVCFYPQKGESGKPNEWDREKIRQSWTLQVRAAAHAQATPLCVTHPDHGYRVAWFSTRNSTRPPRKNALLATWIARSTASLRFHRSPQRSSPSFSPSLLPTGVNAIANAQRRLRSAESAARPRSRSLETTHLRPNCLPTPLLIIPRLEGSRSRRRSRFGY